VVVGAAVVTVFSVVVLLVVVVFGTAVVVGVVVGLADVVVTGGGEPVPVIGVALAVILELLCATELATPGIRVGPGTVYDIGEV
jgi:hypothetical protein